MWWWCYKLLLWAMPGESWWNSYDFFLFYGGDLPLLRSLSLILVMFSTFLSSSLPDWNSALETSSETAKEWDSYTLLFSSSESLLCDSLKTWSFELSFKDYIDSSSTTFRLSKRNSQQFFSNFLDLSYYISIKAFCIKSSLAFSYLDSLNSQIFSILSFILPKSYSKHLFLTFLIYFLFSSTLTSFSIWQDSSSSLSIYFNTLCFIRSYLSVWMLS